MPLHDLQCALVDAMFDCPAAGVPKGSHSASLSKDEGLWLQSLQGSNGFAATRDIQQWWRRARLYLAIPLTMRALRIFEQEDLVDKYIATVRCHSLFFVPEAKAFADFFAEQKLDNAFVAPILQFEIALRCANEYWASEKNPSSMACAQAAGAQKYGLSPLATAIPFPCSATAVLSLLVQDRSPQALVEESCVGERVSQCSTLLVSPDMKPLWRLASPAEEKVLRQLDNGGYCTVAELKEAGGESLLSDQIIIGVH